MISLNDNLLSLSDVLTTLYAALHLRDKRVVLVILFAALQLKVSIPPECWEEVESILKSI